MPRELGQPGRPLRLPQHPGCPLGPILMGFGASSYAVCSPLWAENVSWMGGGAGTSGTRAQREPDMEPAGGNVAVSVPTIPTLCGAGSSFSDPHPEFLVSGHLVIV